MLSQEIERDLLLYVIQNPNSTQKELAGYARLSPGTINWHMKRLIGSGLVAMKREGQFVRYSVNGEHVEIINLLRNYHPSTFQLWVDRFMNAVDTVTQVDVTEEVAERSKIQKVTSDGSGPEPSNGIEMDHKSENAGEEPSSSNPEKHED